MKNCATCRFMAAERYGLDISGARDSDHRTCVRVIFGSGPSYPYPERDEEYVGDPRTEPAAVLDGSGYAARLVVLPSFGCVLHEER